MHNLQANFRLAYAAAEAQVASAEAPFVVLATRGSLTLELYQPQKLDHQQPHDRDECYVITEGTGMFQMGNETVPFLPGDFLFVAAGVPHRFVDFGDRMTCWVIFYGPQGGEAGT